MLQKLLKLYFIIEEYDDDPEIKTLNFLRVL